tara:strand:- start:12889 stop:14307 length:1419 start_codon:yes stop_codon:yes gene_type:complete
VARKWDTNPLKSKLTLIGSSLVLACLSSQAFAAAFQVQEQNVSQLGLAYSGTAALAEDATTGFWNAAGLSKIKNSQVVLGGVLAWGIFDYDVRSAHNSVPTIPGVNDGLVSGNNDDAGSVATIPNFAVATRFADRWVLGFNVNTPFGLKTEYDENSVARYVATLSKLEVWNFSPSISYEWLPCLSFGAGIDAAYGKAKLNSNIGSNGNFIPNVASADDGYQHNTAEGWALGFHLGALWDILPTTRVGLSFRSKLNMHVEGDSETVSNPRLPNGANAANKVYSVREVQANVTLPESWIFSVKHDLNDEFTLTGDFHWTNWSRVDLLSLRFAPGALINNANAAPGSPPIGIDTDTELKFKDTIRVAAGLIWNYNQCWSYRFGLAYDESPVQAEHRTARIPDSDRWWFAVGAVYNFLPDWRADFGYSYIKFKDADMNDRGPNAYAVGQPISAANLVAKYKASAHLFGLQLRYDFV